MAERVRLTARPDEIWGMSCSSAVNEDRIEEANPDRNIRKVRSARAGKIHQQVCDDPYILGGIPDRYEVAAENSRLSLGLRPRSGREDVIDTAVRWIEKWSGDDVGGHWKHLGNSEVRSVAVGADS